MAKIWQPQPREVLLSWIEAIINEASDQLNDWETKFIEDMHVRILGGGSLTQPQEEKLESIYADKTS